MCVCVCVCVCVCACACLCVCVFVVCLLCVCCVFVVCVCERVRACPNTTQKMPKKLARMPAHYTVERLLRVHNTAVSVNVNINSPIANGTTIGALRIRTPRWSYRYDSYRPVIVQAK